VELVILTIISTIYAFLISWSTEYVMTYTVGSRARRGVPVGTVRNLSALRLNTISSYSRHPHHIPY